jgi:hypothetical protein
MSPSSPLTPTFRGHIASTQDALLLFEACLSGALNHVARRPHDRERSSLIKSGNVFIYEEHSSGIKRWTDGVPWSPSRILGNFLVYRELERPFPPGEKKRAMKRSKRSPGIGRASESYEGLGTTLASSYGVGASAALGIESGNGVNSLNKETERSLIGSLIDSYGFKDEGLVKKTVSVTVGGVSHHLVSYYTVADILNNKLGTPTKDPRFQQISPRLDLITKQNFRTPIDEVDTMERMDERSIYNGHPYARNGYERTNQTICHRTTSLPTPPISYAQNPTLYGGYSLTSHPGEYHSSIIPADSNNGFGSQYIPASEIYPLPTPKIEGQDHGGYRQQLDMPIVGSRSENVQLHMPIITNFPRRASLFEHGSSVDSALSSESADSKITSDSGYSSQGFFGGLRDVSNISQNYTAQRSLPTPSLHSAYSESFSHPYAMMHEPTQKDHAWSVGNSSTGHGHFLATPPQQWASASASWS